MRLLLYLMLLLTPSLALSSDGAAEPVAQMDPGISCTLALADPPSLPSDTEYPIPSATPLSAHAARSPLCAEASITPSTAIRFTPQIRAPPCNG